MPSQFCDHTLQLEQLQHQDKFKMVNTKPKLKGTCDKCSHRKFCKKPCKPVENYLSEDNPRSMERPIGNNAILLYPKHNEINESALSTFTFENGKSSFNIRRIFSDGNGSPFLSAVEPQLTQTGIFVDRFFFRKGFAEIAKKYDISEGAASKMYAKAKNKLLKTVKAMDRVDFARDIGKPLVNMPKGVRVFLLSVVFKLSNSEISRLLDIHHSLVHRYLNQIRDRIITGEIDLLDYTDEDLQAAKARLEDAREKKKAQDKAYHLRRKKYG